MKDVANEAKVSIKTVSRVINKEPNVSMKTAAKIEKVIQRLDYQPNAFAQSLARSTPKIISLIYDTPSPNYISHIMEGVLSFCYGADDFPFQHRMGIVFLATGFLCYMTALLQGYKDQDKAIDLNTINFKTSKGFNRAGFIISIILVITYTILW